MRLITLPEYDVRTYIPPDDVWGILAAPPCREFSIAKGNSPRDFKAGMEIVEACLEIIWLCRFKSKLKFWALENPRGFLRQFLGIPHFTFEHWFYGDMQIKPTDIWGYFRKPRQKLKIKPSNLSEMFPNGRINGRGWSSPKTDKKWQHLSRAERRAITPQGFAEAFFKANR